MHSSLKMLCICRVQIFYMYCLISLYNKGLRISPILGSEAENKCGPTGADPAEAKSTFKSNFKGLPSQGFILRSSKPPFQKSGGPNPTQRLDSDPFPFFNIPSGKR